MVFSWKDEVFQREHITYDLYYYWQLRVYYNFETQHRNTSNEIIDKIRLIK